MKSNQKTVATAILSTPGFGVKTYQRIKRFCDAQDLSLWEWWSSVGKSPILAREVSLSSQQRDCLTAFKFQYSPESYWQQLQDQQISVIWEEEPEYPEHLASISGHPVLLFAKGALQLLRAQRMVGVVGTRKMTAYGELVTKKIVHELVSSQATIVSGGMYGVDITAHLAALEHSGDTIVVLGFGFGRWYPRSGQNLEASLLNAGALLLSEYPPGTSPSKGTFLQRNRIIAGLSQAVVVTEAAKRSGSINTAHVAAEYGKDVWAVPGPITSLYSEGVKNLINEGAKLLTSGYEVFDSMGFEESVASTNSLLSKDMSLAQKILHYLTTQPMGTEELGAQLVAPLSEVLPTLSLLEMQQQIERRGLVWLKI